MSMAAEPAQEPAVSCDKGKGNSVVTDGMDPADERVAAEEDYQLADVKEGMVQATAALESLVQPPIDQAENDDQLGSSQVECGHSDLDKSSAGSESVDLCGRSEVASHTSWGEEVENSQSVLTSVENLINNNTSACKVVKDSSKQGSVNSPLKSSNRKEDLPNSKMDKGGDTTSHTTDCTVISDVAKLEVEVTEVTSRGVTNVGCRGDRKDSASVESPQSMSSASSHESASDIQSEVSFSVSE